MFYHVIMEHKKNCSFEMVTQLMMKPLVHQRIALRLSQKIKVVRLQSSSFFTNTESMKRDDPYAQLGITWGATTSEIKNAFKAKARALHPDVNKVDTPEQALQKFQEVQKAYESLMNINGAHHRDDLTEQWSFAIWRNSDIIAQQRTDVAGVLKKRPAKPAASLSNKQWGIAALGHPDGSGSRLRKAEYIGDGIGIKGPRSSTVGTGRSKWVKPKEFKPWKKYDEEKLHSKKPSE
jgi:curved DNA-binding protein CbpA